MKNKHGVDIDEVIKNARSEGINPGEIMLIYKGLTAGEILKLSESFLLTAQSKKCVIGKITLSGKAMFADKISGVYSLGA